MQHKAKQRKESSLKIRVLQPRANLCDALFITRNQIKSAVRVRSSALYFSCKTHKSEEFPIFVAGLYQQYVSSRL